MPFPRAKVRVHRTKGEPDPAFAAEMAELTASADQAAAERRAEFQAAWARRLERDTPPPVPASELHRHTAECFGDQAPQVVYLHNGWLEGRYCKRFGFVAERVAANPTALK